MENYMKFEMIGKGSCGNCVFLVKNLTNNKVSYFTVKKFRFMQ